jgi:sugar O-acyltransferase (sialic acid O-acetyltransferase NeuD family)
MSKLLILGAGGYGRVVAETAELEGRWDKIAFLDDREDIIKALGFDVIGKIDDFTETINQYESAFAAIGDNQKRRQWIDRLLSAGYKVPAVIHPKASVSKYSLIGAGTAVLANSTVNTNSSIGKGCIININSCIDHDCKIGDGVHICSGAVVRSMVSIGKGSYIGAAACVKAGVCLEENFVLTDGENI